MAKVFTVETKGKGGVWLEAHLPMTPYEMLDLLDKEGLTREEVPTGEICDCNISMDASALLAGKQHNLYELNALAWKLASMDDIQRIAFDGLVKMDSDKKDGPISLGRLIDLAYSVDCCDVYPGIATYEELGHFYVENDLVPELKVALDEDLRSLNYEEIGRKFSKEEGGVLVAGGYVLQTLDVKEVFHALDLKPQKPGYAILLEAAQGGRATQLSLPASPQVMDTALSTIGARDWRGLSLRCLDCRVPSLTAFIGDDDSIDRINQLAGLLAPMNGKQIAKFKALLDAGRDYSVPGATYIAANLNAYPDLPQRAAGEGQSQSAFSPAMA